MAEETTAAEAVTPETKTEPAATVALPADVEAAMKNMGFSNVQEMIAAAGQYQYAGTPEGYQRLVQVVAEKEGANIAKARLAADPDSVLKDADKDLRRKVRRAVARRDESGIPVETDDAEDLPNPAEEAKAAAREAKEIAQTARNETRVAAQAVSIAPQLLALATKDPRIANNFPVFTDEVSALVASGHPKYSGANGIKNASEDVINRWEGYGSMAGMKRPTPAAPEKGADVPIPTKEDADKTVQAALEEARGQGSGSFIDALMAKIR